MRVRGFTQDDGHIFCTEDQILPECVAFTTLAAEGLRGLRLHGHHLQGRHAAGQARRRGRRRGTRPRTRCMESLRESRRARSRCSPGEGAFYGPKIEYSPEGRDRPRVAVRHDAGRLQHAAAPRRGVRRRGQHAQAPGHAAPRHRGLDGALHRHPASRTTPGALPLWLAPVQVVVMNVDGPPGGLCAGGRAGALRDAGFRVAADLRNEKITYKIREHSIQKLPYQLVLGDKEVAARTVSARTRAGENLAPVPLEAFISRLKRIDARK